MNTKNILLYTLIALSPLQLCGMEPSTCNNSNSNNSKLPPLKHNLKRDSETNLFSPSPEKKSRTESPQGPELDDAEFDYLIGLEQDFLYQPNNSFTPLQPNHNFNKNNYLKRLSEPNIFHSSPSKNARTSSPKESESFLLFPKKMNVDPIANTAQETMQIDSAPITCTTVQQSPFYLDVAKAIYDINPAALSNLLISNGITQLSKEEKEALYKSAKEHKGLIKEINSMGNKITSKTDDQEIKKNFSHDAEYKKIQTITHNLDTLKTLPKLTFPQAFFTNAPRYRPAHQNTTPDQALFTLIKNEQEEISVCCFSFDSAKIAEKLIRKKNKGVNVKVITDQKQAKKVKNNLIIQRLVNNGIPVLAPQNDAYEQNHLKATLFKCNIFNKELLSHGSFNYTDNATERSWENMEVSDDPYVIAQHKEQFAALEDCSKPIYLNEKNY